MPSRTLSRRRLRYLLRPTTERVVVLIALVVVVATVLMISGKTGIG
jgi:hypothetical protein